MLTITAVLEPTRALVVQVDTLLTTTATPTTLGAILLFKESGCWRYLYGHGGNLPSQIIIKYNVTKQQGSSIDLWASDLHIVDIGARGAVPITQPALA